jgi:hypothetical protein
MMQHTKTVTGYHGLSRDNDAIVMGCVAFSTQRPAVFLGWMPGAAQPAGGKNGGLQCKRRHG